MFGKHLSGGSEDDLNCTSYGVACDANGDVVLLKLTADSALRGTLPSMIASLTQLTELSVAGCDSCNITNDISGTLPTEIGKNRLLAITYSRTRLVD
jgi:hypothetical protein